MSENKRVLPPSDKFASCPYDENIFDYYNGQFETVYVLLHPFIKSDMIDWDKITAKTYPSKNEMIEKCTPVAWQEILKITPFKNISEIDVGLRSWIHGIKKHNENFVDYLHKLYDEEHIVTPSEGDLPPLIENRLYAAIKKLGYEWLWIGNEFADERKLHYIDELISGDLIPTQDSIFTHDYALLLTTHWDSHCSFLCSSKNTIEKILAIDPFEGFYCTSDTQVYWGLHSSDK
jgi:Protein of unknown function (DUF2711)